MDCFTQMAWLLLVAWFDITCEHRNKHTKYTGTNILTHIKICINTICYVVTAVLCIALNECLTHWYQKFTLHRGFTVPLLFKNKCFAELSHLFMCYFFICCLAAPWPTLGHCWGNSLTHPFLITALLKFQPRSHQELRHNEAGSLKPAECLMRFELGTFQPYHNALKGL